MDESCTKNEQNRICRSNVFLQLLFSSFFCRRRFNDSKPFWKRGLTFPWCPKLRALAVSSRTCQKKNRRAREECVILLAVLSQERLGLNLTVHSSCLSCEHDPADEPHGKRDQSKRGHRDDLPLVRRPREARQLGAAGRQRLRSRVDQQRVRPHLRARVRLDPPARVVRQGSPPHARQRHEGEELPRLPWAPCSRFTWTGLKLSSRQVIN